MQMVALIQIIDKIFKTEVKDLKTDLKDCVKYVREIIDWIAMEDETKDNFDERFLQAGGTDETNLDTTFLNPSMGFSCKNW